MRMMRLMKQKHVRRKMKKPEESGKNYMIRKTTNASKS